jgi:hypothetical protein
MSFQMTWVISFLNAGWTLQWMTWPVFLKTILLGDFNHILNINNIKLMAGGFNLAIDYMYLTYTLFFLLPLTLKLYFPSSSTVHPGLNNTNFDQFWNNLLQLSLQLPMFPHPQDLVASASKIQRDNDLMVVASTITRTPFPRSIILDTEEDLRKACKNQALVIKREFSDSTHCTYLPPNEGEDPGLRLQRVMRKLVETQRLYSGIRSLPPPTWMGQPFISSLQKGELRAFVVGGRLEHVIHTWTEQSTHEFVDNVTPLSLLW